ncbi:DNA-3-methyladenine glycosylase 2 family protein [Oryzomicrobium sp.]|uniref:DNA-3-methyladenine glycosylase family protein n=1 Tax=Oryzomicrobium sp. TaxID=1911578 RepID=UPI0025F87D53|nr:DNA-3-methyladenine glycosylase 2 family protein [Oryzomicrobium sp.]MCE1242987.1 DNA-3-methyladenine glycosylase 2 family protein [Oryzomicrobium sp.]
MPPIAPENPAPYRDASAHLAGVDADWAWLVATVGPCTHAPKPAREPYEALIRAVAYQQLHVRAADAMVARFLALFPEAPFPTPQQILATAPEALRACGFSTRKVATIQALAAGAASGLVPGREEALALEDDALVARLTALPGIGRWTVEMFLIYTLERLDILPVDDFGVRDGYRRLKSLPAAPGRRELAAAGDALRPYRTIAAWYLWRVPKDKTPAATA